MAGFSNQLQMCPWCLKSSKRAKEAEAQLAARDAELGKLDCRHVQHIGEMQDEMDQLRTALGAIRLNARLGYGAAVTNGDDVLIGVLDSIERSALFALLGRALGQGGGHGE